MTENQKNDNTIRNVDMKEYLAEKKAEMTNIEPIENTEEILIDKSEDENDDEPILKPKTSKFEPNPQLFRLPSGGVTLEKNKLIDSEYIYVRRTTTKEEDTIYDFISKLSNINSDEAMHYAHEMYDMIDRVIEQCVKTNIPVTELLYCDRDALFNFVTALGYGSTQEIEYECSECKTVYNVKFDLIKDTKIKYLTESKIKCPTEIVLSSFDNIKLELRGLKIGDTKYLFDKNASQSDLFKAATINAYDVKTKEKISVDEQKELFDNLNNEDRIKIKKYLDSFSNIGLMYTFDKKVCTNNKCKLLNKKVEIEYSLSYLLFNVIKVKNVFI